MDFSITSTIEFVVVNFVAASELVSTATRSVTGYHVVVVFIV
jgi:hypothetical protein